MTQFSIDMPPALQRWVESRIAEGRYTDAGDYLRDLIRRDLEGSADETEWLRAMVEEGLASGVIERDASDVLRDIMAERPARRG